jgi:hypothetical protein
MRSPSGRLLAQNARNGYHKPLTISQCPSERITLPRKVREYFAEIGKRGGQTGRRELTRQQAKLLVAIREAKRAAQKEGKLPPKIDRKTLALLRKPEAKRR